MSKSSIISISLVFLFIALAASAIWVVRKNRIPPPRFTIDDVVEALPQSNVAHCTTAIGDFSPAEDIIAPHVEGAVGGADGEYVLISGFSHYFNRLITSPRVDRLPQGTFTWIPEYAQAPVNGSHMQAASYGKSVWIAGGFMGTAPGIASDKVWEFRLESAEWVQRPSLPAARASGGFVAHEHQLHYIGGLEEDNATVVDEHLILDATDPKEWKRVADFPRARNHFQAVSVGGFIYAVGGMTGHHGKHSKDLPFLDVYHPVHQQWIPAADMPESRSHAEMATMTFRDRILVAGGRTNKDSYSSLDSVVEYNPHLNRWKKIATLPRQLYSGFALIVNDKFYVGGGGRIWKEPSLETWVANISIDCSSENTPQSQNR